MIAATERSLCFVCAKWIAISAVGAAPLLLIVAAARQSFFGLIFAMVAPLMAASGYGICVVLRLLAISHRDDDPPKNYFPATWPFPFSLVNWLYRLESRPRVRWVAATIVLTFINGFFLAWATFLLLCVLTATIAICLQWEFFQ